MNELREGDRIGRFTIVRQVGAGAMGIVYEARDPELGRSIALKVLPVGRQSSNVRLRLAREAQALAQLQHPNVVAVHDVGLADGRVFLAMELVEGTTLDRYLRKDSPWRDVLAAYVQAGKGLAAAHGKGLVHRDFKPSNVLVDRDGRVRVGDFGLARLAADEETANVEAELATAPDTVAELPVVPETVDSGATTAAGVGASSPDLADLLAAPLTETNAFLGTPRYMAPEQFARRPATAASDQFAFCVALWESLYGQHPFAAGDDLGGLAAAVGAGKPRAVPRGRAPSRVQRLLTRGLSPDPAQRHPSMAVLVAALEAVPIRRRRVAAAFAGVGVVAAAGVAIAATRPSPEATCARAETDAAARIAPLWAQGVRDGVKKAFLAVGVPYAEDTFNRVDAAIYDRQKAWARAHREACEATHVRGQQSEALLDLRVQCLERARLGIAALVEAFGKADRATLDRSRTAAGAIGDPAACSNAQQLMTPLPKPTDARLRARIAEVQARVADLDAAYKTGQSKRVASTLDDVVEAAKQTEWPPIYAEAQLHAAWIETAEGHAARAERRFRSAIETSGLARTDLFTAQALSSLAWVVGYHQDRHAEGHLLFDVARGALARADAPPRLRAADMDREASVYVAEGKSGEALALEQRALAVWESAPHPDPFAIALALSGIADAARPMGRLPEAWAAAKRALELAESSLGEAHPVSVGVMSTAVNVLCALGRYDEAAYYAERSVVAREQTLPPEHPSLAFSINLLGMVRAYQGRYEEARIVLERALSIRERTLGKAHSAVGYTLLNLGAVARRQHRYSDSIAQLEKAKAIHVKAMGPESKTIAYSCEELGDTFRDVGRFEDARREYDCAIRYHSKEGGDENVATALSLVGMAELDLLKGNTTAASAALEKAFALQTKYLSADSPALIMTLVNLVDALLATKDVPRAVELAERATTIAFATPRPAVERGRARFASAKVRWERNQGDDRQQATRLAVEARALLQNEPPYLRKQVDGWLAKHKR